MATSAETPPDGAITSAADLAARMTTEAVDLQAEVEEIELLINQAKTEASRHEARRTAAVEKLAMGAERLDEYMGKIQ